MSLAPDLEGLQDALNRKRNAMGENVVFHFAATKTYPEGTQLDPLTGRPYDPLLAASKEETPADVTKLCSVAFRPSFKEDTEESRLGDVKQNEALIWLPLADWEEVETAVSFSVKGDRYLIRKSTPDGIGSDYRQLVWGEREGSA